MPWLRSSARGPSCRVCRMSEPTEPHQPWDGHGLPPSAEARLRRHGSGTTTSFLSVPEAAALATVGFDVVGEVLGACVVTIGWAGFGGCGYTSYRAPSGTNSSWTVDGRYGVDRPATILSSSKSRFAGFGPQVKAIRSGYATALRRMTDEAAAMGADGIVGVTLRQQASGQDPQRDTVEFVSLGTAVRAVASGRRRRLERPFTALLSGTEAAAALLGGLVPVAVNVGVSVGVRHADWKSQGQAGSWRNTEVYAHTDLATAVRSDARQQFADELRASGASTAVVSSMSLVAWPVGQGSGHLDYVARSVILGTGLLSFQRRTRPARARPLSILPRRPPTPSEGRS
ncbi:MAG: hypothetical protein QOJ32_160 [Frankiaceae bacterium]|nr:hypothetical protein [Frankiaceae bacterium]